MENYNPRQITRMRWKDAKELESLSIIVGNFDFENEVLENVSQDSEYSKLVNKIKKSIRSGSIISILVMDKGFGVLFNGFVNGANVELTSASGDTIYNVSLDYEATKDELKINLIEETLISQDNVKTIFGQSISGTGNIDLYRHELYFKGNNSSITITLTYYSSNKLPVNSAQDLTNITKAVNNETFIACTGFEDNGTITQANGIYFENNIWKFGYYYYGQGTPQFNALCNLDEFYDNVTTI